MGFEQRIRVLALGLIRHNNRLFVSEGIDPQKEQKFYRFLGGGVDFGEPSEVALKREFQEEIAAELTNIIYLGCLENIFTFNGSPGHEIIQLYQCDFVDNQFYDQEERWFQEGIRQKRALWLPENLFISKELVLYPDGVLSYL